MMLSMKSALDRFGEELKCPPMRNKNSLEALLWEPFLCNPICVLHCETLLLVQENKFSRDVDALAPVSVVLKVIMKKFF